jgi:hypothetical protein
MLLRWLKLYKICATSNRVGGKISPRGVFTPLSGLQQWLGLDFWDFRSRPLMRF